MFKVVKTLAQTQDQAPARAETQPRPLKAPDNIHISGMGATVAVVLMILGILGVAVLDGRVADGWIAAYVIVFMLAGIHILFALKVARQWEKAVVLRLGKFHGLRGSGMLWIFPIIDTTPNWIDYGVMVSPFNAEKALTINKSPFESTKLLDYDA